MLSLHIESDGEIGCRVYIVTYFDSICYYTDYDLEKELEIILKACQPCDNFEQNFYKVLGIEKDLTSYYKKKIKENENGGIKETN